MTSLRVARLVIIASALIFGAGCGSDENTTSPSSKKHPDASTDARDASGGSGGTGGLTLDGSAGSAIAGTGGGTTDSGDADAGCLFTGTPLDPTALGFPVCPLCQNAHCVPTSLVPPETLSQLADCPEGDGSSGDGAAESGTSSESGSAAATKCVPDKYIAYNGKFILDSCRSLQDAEGRCVSKCVPLVEQQAAFLPQSTCAADELCAPCYDPRTGALTGACNVGCDPGPTEAPVTFQKCCGGIGSCVPTGLVPTSQQSYLGQDTCTDSTMLCAPDSLVTGKPAVCRSLENAEGRCVPACLPSVGSRASILPTTGCNTGEVCAPCYDPISGASTGACSINGDAPTEQPFVFSTPCCHDLGVCVPSSIVPSSFVSQLGPDSCTGTSELCVPKDLANTSYKPTVCTSLNNSEGRCLPDCLPPIASQASFLPQDICPQYYLCAPCYNPLGGASTGACTLNGDAPTQGPTPYASCCNGIGSCLPPALNMGATTLFSVDTCTGAGDLCVPNFITNQSYQAPKCASIDGFEGRCQPDCLVITQSEIANSPQSTCDAHFLCVPCYDPVSGADTFGCRMFGDAPTQPPSTFEKCCGGSGSCVPSSVASADLQPYLGRDTCTDSTALCEPDQLADKAYVPPTCTSLAGGEGRCLPTCLPGIAAQASSLPQDVCAAGSLCAPCYNPINGAATPWCGFNGDAPAQGPTLYPSCCGNLGTCVPSTIVPTDDQSYYGTDTCTGSGVLCVPTNIAASGSYTPPLCASNGGFEGRCLPSCLPGVQALGTLPQSSCSAGNVCAPCYDPITAADTGACRLNTDAPTQPPGQYGKCCNNNGTCEPSTVVPASQKPLMVKDVCLNTGDLCVPNEYVNTTSFIPPTCSSIAGAEGRCLSTCLSISLPASYMPQSTCTTSQHCVPCYNPATGTPTGACTIDGDTPKVTPPYTFPACCSSNGICAPDSTLSSAQATYWPQLTCPSSPGTWSCTPKAKVTNPTAKLPTCEAYTPFGFFPIDIGPGACMSSCFVTSTETLLQSTCSTGQVCVPCTEPFGASTGVCE